MNPKKRYIVQDFVQHAHKRFPREFASVADPSRYKFNRKTFLDANNAIHEVVVLLVGQYHKRRGGPSVWARATGSSIQYFQGPKTEEACTLITEDQHTRIYYDGLYSTMAGPQDGKGMTVGRRAGQIVVETFINFLFLWTGYLKEVNNVEKSDMLTNFEYACMKIQSVHAGPSALKSPIKQHQGASRPPADQQASRKRKWEAQEASVVEEGFSRIKTNVDEDEVVFIKTDHTPSVIGKHHESIPTHKMNLASDGGREVAVPMQIQTLQEKLNKQMLKIQAMEKRSAHDNEKRRAAERKTNELERRLTEETRANGYLKTQLAESKTQIAYWKAQHALQREKGLAWRTGAVNWKKVVVNLRAEGSTPRKR